MNTKAKKNPKKNISSKLKSIKPLKSSKIQHFKPKYLSKPLAMLQEHEIEQNITKSNQHLQIPSKGSKERLGSSSNISDIRNGSRVTLKSIRRQKSDFRELSKVIGQGSYGQIKVVGDTETGSVYAMKIIDKSTLLNLTSVQNIKKEIKIQSKLNHPHITKLFFYFEDDENVYMILEYAEKGKIHFFSPQSSKILFL